MEINRGSLGAAQMPISSSLDNGVEWKRRDARRIRGSWVGYAPGDRVPDGCGFRGTFGFRRADLRYRGDLAGGRYARRGLYARGECGRGEAPRSRVLRAVGLARRFVVADKLATGDAYALSTYAIVRRTPQCRAVADPRANGIDRVPAQAPRRSCRPGRASDADPYLFN